MSNSDGQDDRNPQQGWLGRLVRALGFKATASIRDNLEDALGEQARSTDFTAQERAMLRNILATRSIRVADVMVPRAEIVAVPADITLVELLRAFRTQGHSRLPAYGETLDDPKGMVHIRDFLDYLTTRAESAVKRGRRKQDAAAIDLGLVDLTQQLSAARLLRPVLYVPPSMPAMDLLVRMQSTRTHMALVVDEYGGTDGLVSIEDLVEMIVGDIEDEHDDLDRPLIEASGDGLFTAEAKASLEEVGRTLGVDFTEEEAAADVDTIGGLVVTLAQRVPSRGEVIKAPFGLEIEVLDADPRRVKRVRIARARPDGQPRVAVERDPTIEPASAPATGPAAGKD